MFQNLGVWLIGRSMNFGWVIAICRNLTGCMGRHGTVLWGLVLGLLWPIPLEGFYISPWIKNYTFSYLKPQYKKQVEGGEFCNGQNNFWIHLCYKEKVWSNSNSFCTLLQLLKMIMPHNKWKRRNREPLTWLCIYMCIYLFDWNQFRLYNY